MTTPRLQSLSVRDFRSISGEWSVPLDADVVLIHGQNGSGKTSLLSALELAATGRISYLDRIGDDEYLRHMHHRGTASGQVELTVSSNPGRLVGSAAVSARGVTSEPLLDPRLSQAFVERCFLPQATLGRLFEVYAPRTKNTTDTPLIRFVKEVLGLDSLEALIDGLYPAAHVTRVEKLSSGWTQTLSRSQELDRRRELAVTAQTNAQARRDTAVAALGLRLDLDDAAVERPKDINAAAVRLLASQADLDDEIARVREAQLRLDAVEAALGEYALLDVDPNESESETGILEAQRRLQAWNEETSASLRAWYGASHDDTAGDEDPRTVLRALRLELSEVEAAISARQRREDAVRDLDARAATSQQRLQEVLTALEDLSDDRASASTSTAATDLATLLVTLLEHTDKGVCPVCDQDYRSPGTLRDHVLGKINTLHSDAARLLAVEGRRSELQSARLALEAELKDFAVQRAQFTADRDDVRLDALKRQREALRGLEPIGEAGAFLADEVDRLRDREMRHVRGRAMLDSGLSDLGQIAASLQVVTPHGLVAQRVAALRAVAKRELENLEGRRRRVAEVVRLRAEIQEAAELFSGAEGQVAALDREGAALSRQVKEARRRKEEASTLRKKAETLRTATITGVFDDHLNGSWKRIFGALVPSEPFIPQFKRIPAGSRQVTVDVETVHRDGLEAATPSAMLSQGNLNTAALSLFIALHFAVPEELPWLIFDDPVQSMDDLHISNFASMIKQLTRRNGRQVVIAVHERELFEYLALELTPASPEEELLTVVLDRTYGESILSTKRIPFTEDTALSPSPAA